MEKSPEERARVSAAVLRSFLNIADRWELSSSERLELLQCDARQYGEWSTVARSNGPLVLEIAVLLRISALLGVFKDAQQLYGSSEKERDWLRSTNMAVPYQGRAPIDLLRGTLDDQLAVRGEVAAIRWGGGVAPNAIDKNFTKYTDEDLIWVDERPQIRAVCFDGFGTLVEIVDKRRPFRALLGHASASEAVTQALTTPMSLRDLARDLATVPDEERLVELEADLSAETASTRLRPEIEAVWRRLGELGLKIGVCSNLAAPYGAALLGCLPSAPDAAVLSFEVGMMKPQVEIYQLVCQRLNLEPHQVLFVGDSIDADVIGPRNAGLFAMHIAEFETGFDQGVAPGAPQPIRELLWSAAAFSSHA